MHANNKSGLMDAEKISVLIDSVSFAALIGNNREASALLAYQNSDFLEMIRTPLDVQNTLLQAIPQYTLKKAPDGTDFIEELLVKACFEHLEGSLSSLGNLNFGMPTRLKLLCYFQSEQQKKQSLLRR
jgi:hypothetical protein